MKVEVEGLIVEWLVGVNMEVEGLEDKEVKMEGDEVVVFEGSGE